MTTASASSTNLTLSIKILASFAVGKGLSLNFSFLIYTSSSLAGSIVPEFIVLEVEASDLIFFDFDNLILISTSDNLEQFSNSPLFL